MGDVIDLAAFRGRRRRSARERAAVRPAPGAVPAGFYFDLASPFTYLAAERVERGFGELAWIPASGEPGAPDRAAWRRACVRAAGLRLPLVRPDRLGDTPRAMRAAAHAAATGRGAAFVLSACRLAWAGGFDLEDPGVLADAAAAAGVAVADCLAAAGDPGRDAAIAQAGRRVRAAGADRLPALVVGRAVFAGEDRLAEAAAAARAGHVAVG